MCLGNVSGDFSSANALKTGLHGYAYNFSVEYHVFNDVEIHDIHGYLMKKNGIL